MVDINWLCKRFLNNSTGAALSFGISCYQAVKLLSAS